MSASLISGGVKPGAHLERRARTLRRLAAGACIVAALSIAPVAAAQTAKPAPRAGGHAATNRDDASRPHVYLMRGLLNIFSLGMDQLAAQIARNGVDASVYNHSVEESAVGAIVQKYRAGDHGPYILVGHSLGADAVMVMAQQLNAQNVPVALVVPFDGTESYAAPGNVNCVVNLTQRKYAYVQAGPGFHGKLSNVDVSSDTTIDHVTIDKSPRLQAMALKEILQAARGQSCRPGANAPAVARAKQSGPKEIAPADNGAKESVTKVGAPREFPPANNSAPVKTPAPANTAARAKTAASAKSPVAARSAVPARSAAPTKSATPTAPAHSAAPATGASPDKSAATAHAS
jgi:pimeloyl-ACP methyl ester carboxylesterase